MREDPWGGSEWTRMHLARYVFGLCDGNYTNDDVKEVPAQCQGHAQAIVRADSPLQSAPDSSSSSSSSGASGSRSGRRLWPGPLALMSNR